MISTAHDPGHDHPEQTTVLAASSPAPVPPPVRPPDKHQLALMIWIAVFPTLTVLNLALGGWLKTMPAVPRTFVLATIAVPIVIYGLMPPLHRLRARLLAHAGRHGTTLSSGPVRMARRLGRAAGTTGHALRLAKVLITNLHNLTQTLIRYELSDSFTATPGAQPGGYLRATVEGREAALTTDRLAACAMVASPARRSQSAS